MEVTSRSVHDESALFDEDDNEEDEIVLGRSNAEPEVAETSKQRLLSKQKLPPQFEGLKTLPSGHKIQEIRELMTVPVRTDLDYISPGIELTSIYRSSSPRTSLRALLLSKSTVSTLMLTRGCTPLEHLVSCFLNAQSSMVSGGSCTIVTGMVDAVLFPFLPPNVFVCTLYSTTPPASRSSFCFVALLPQSATPTTDRLSPIPPTPPLLSSFMPGTDWRLCL